MRILVTGGAGFIGSAVCRHLVDDPGNIVVNVDKLTYAGNLDSLRSIENRHNYKHILAHYCPVKSRINSVAWAEPPAQMCCRNL